MNLEVDYIGWKMGWMMALYGASTETRMDTMDKFWQEHRPC